MKLTTNLKNIQNLRDLQNSRNAQELSNKQNMQNVQDLQNVQESQKLQDIQKEIPALQIEINKVGIKRLVHPVKVKVSLTEIISTIAKFDMFTNLAKDKRGAHMSRFVEILNSQEWELSIPGMYELMEVVLSKHQSTAAYINTSFDIFLNKEAPVSKAKSLVNYQVEMYGELFTTKERPTTKDKEFKAKECINVSSKEKKLSALNFSVKIPVTSLCPCSKEISKYGAHNQRAYIKITISLSENADVIYFDEIIKIAESSASSEIYSVLKRTDEKFVSEKAYENPKFVEDVAREIANSLTKDRRISNFTIEIESLESIHNHSAYAMITSI